MTAEPADVFDEGEEEPRPEPKLALGAKVPEIELKGGPRKKVALSSLWGKKPVALVFLHALDGPFATEPAVQWRDGGAPVEQAGGEIVAVCQASSQDGMAFRERWNLDYRLLADPQGVAYEAFDVTPELPGTFVIDTSGVLQFAHRNDAPLDSAATWAHVDSISAITGSHIERPKPKVLPPEEGDLRFTPDAQSSGFAPLSAYACAKCGGTSYEVLDVSTASGALSRVFNFQHRRFSAVVCQRCRYVELYQAESGLLRNAADLLLGS